MKLSISSLVLASAMLCVGTMAGDAASNLRGVETKKPHAAAAAKAVNGEKLKMLINCFANYMEDAAYRSDNSKRDGCTDAEITHCRTDSGHNDHFCLFKGTNNLEDLGEIPVWGAPEGTVPKCWFNCQMETCNAWDFPHNEEQEKCVAALSK